MNSAHGIAGKGARDLANRRYLSRQKYLLPLLLIICGLVLFLLVSVGFHSNLGFGALLFPLIGLLLIKAIGRRIDQSVKEERRAVRGAKGEELIGTMLEELDDRFLVFHDLPSPYGNIDHLVVSKQALFLVETKAHGGRVSLVDGQILINNRSPEKDFIAQVARNTAWLGEQMEAKLSTKIWVKPILVFANAYVENPGLIRNIQVIPKGFFLNAILRSSRSGGAWKLWENKEVLAEIFPTISFPPEADLVPSPPPLPPSAQMKAGSSLDLPLPIRRTPMGAVYRLGSPDDLKPGKSEEAGEVTK